jgi:hypothetical protein
MQQLDDIDTAVVTETVFDVPDADMYLIARRDEHALIYAVDDHSDGKDNEFHTTVYYCHGMDDIDCVNQSVDRACWNVSLESKVRGYESRTWMEMYNVEDHYAEQAA